MGVGEFLTTYWGQLGAVGVFIVNAAITRERVQLLEKRVEGVETKQSLLVEQLAKELTEVKQSLARIEGYLEGKLKRAE